MSTSLESLAKGAELCDREVRGVYRLSTFLTSAPVILDGPKPQFVRGLPRLTQIPAAGHADTHMSLLDHRHILESVGQHDPKNFAKKRSRHLQWPR